MRAWGIALGIRLPSKPSAESAPESGQWFPTPNIPLVEMTLCQRSNPIVNRAYSASAVGHEPWGAPPRLAIECCAIGAKHTFSGRTFMRSLRRTSKRSEYDNSEQERTKRPEEISPSFTRGFPRTGEQNRKNLFVFSVASCSKLGERESGLLSAVEAAVPAATFLVCRQHACPHRGATTRDVLLQL